MSTVKLDRGFAYRLRPHGGYQLRVRDPRRSPVEVYISLNTDNPAMAASAAGDYYQRYLAGTWDPWGAKKDSISIRQAIDLFISERKGSSRAKTLKENRRTIESVVDGLSDTASLTLISPNRLRTFIHREELAQASKRSYYTRLAAFFNWAVRCGYLEASPLAHVAKPAEPELLPDSLSHAELDALLHAARTHADTCEHIHRKFVNPYWANDALRLLAWTGLRPSEGARLEWNDVVWPTEDQIGFLRVRSAGMKRTKTDRERVVTLVGPSIEILSELSARSQCKFVLTNHGAREPISIRHLSSRFRKFRCMAGLPDHYSLKSMRHFFGAEYIRRGGSLRNLQGEYGHTSYKTTQGYGIFGTDERMRHTAELYKNG